VPAQTVTATDDAGQTYLFAGVPFHLVKPQHYFCELLTPDLASLESVDLGLPSFRVVVWSKPRRLRETRLEFMKLIRFGESAENVQES
jgi:hypothetical protein